MSDKQPLIGDQPSAPPPYPGPSAPPYSAGPAYPPPPSNYPPPPSNYPPPQLPPPQPPYGAVSNVTVVQARPIGARVILDVKPPNYIVMSIIVLLLFCWVFGLIALIVGLQVDSAWASGDRDGARRMSSAARGWNIAGMIFGVVVYIIVVVSAAASAAAG